MKAMGYKPVDMADAEFQYYKSLAKRHGEQAFADLFETDDDGFITLLTPKSGVPWEVIFFVQNVMINQRLRVIDNFRKKETK